MDVVRGMVVKSSAGRDKGKFLVVVSVQGEDVLVCDGKKRPIERPKRKNIKHLCVTKKVLDEESMAHNRWMRKALGALEKASE